jgi:hypothetical protein
MAIDASLRPLSPRFDLLSVERFDATAETTAGDPYASLRRALRADINWQPKVKNDRLLGKP